MGELFRELQKYGESDYYPYHMPGHKRLALGDLPEAFAKLDITEIEGFDNLHQARGILGRLQEKAAVLYGAEESFFLVNGSTGGVLAAISAALPEGGHLLMARNSHASAYHAAYLRKLRLSYLFPASLEAFDLFEAVAPEQVEEALEREPDIQGVFVVSPTYEGRIADVRGIAGIAHRRGIPLIVDEAHGAHLGFAPGFAVNSCRQGADLVINSVHKTLPALTQSALLHVNGSLIQRELLKRFLHIYQSSSPSYLLMAGIDNALTLVEEQGEELFRRFREQFEELLQHLRVCKHLRFVPLEGGRQDIGKLVISCKNTDLSGRQIYDMLLEEYHLQMEMATESYCLAMFTVADRPEGYTRLEKALLEIDGRIGGGCRRTQEKELVTGGTGSSLEAEIIPLWKAWDMEREQIPLKEAVGRYAGEFIVPYPPGVPVLAPGEAVTVEQCRALQGYLAQGLSVQGIEPAEPYMVKVLREES